MNASDLAKAGAGYALGQAIDTAALWRSGNRRLMAAVQELLRIKARLEELAETWERQI